MILGYQVRRLCKKNQIKVIGVVGSIGKTSTKLAIAEVLKSQFRTRSQEGNYNHLITAPLVFFGEQTPSLFNPLAWIAVFWRNQRQLSRPYPYDIVVLELGTDGPGQIIEFKKYLNLEIGVVTAIAPEHMEFFNSIDEVAKEELSIQKFATLILANKDLCSDNFLKNVSQLLTYSVKTQADYVPKKLGIDLEAKTTAEQYSLLAAATVASKMGVQSDIIKASLATIQPFAGRMQKLQGIHGSIIVDDSYNSSPEAVKLALNSLYEMKAPQKIAVLGNMNELGDYSKGAHEEIGKLCDPKQLELVVTIGPDANEYLAPTAQANGCQVQKFDSPYKAGEYIRPLVKKNAAILVKGSQNRVFAEETIKSLLANPADSQKLVRQSPAWLKKKNKAFGQ
jgi:UDP-N-acetylmuramoyl-tripeptide--D-alanyl-D-alanine ligase